MTQGTPAAAEPPAVTCLLDVNTLIAAIWTTHSHHSKTDAWLQGKRVALCPISELGFLRISSHKKALGASMADARKLLQDFYQNVVPQFIPADASARLLSAANSDDMTEHVSGGSRAEARHEVGDTRWLHPSSSRRVDPLSSRQQGCPRAVSAAEGVSRTDKEPDLHPALSGDEVYTPSPRRSEG